METVALRASTKTGRRKLTCSISEGSLRTFSRGSSSCRRVVPCGPARRPASAPAASSVASGASTVEVARPSPSKRSAASWASRRSASSWARRHVVEERDAFAAVAVEAEARLLALLAAARAEAARREALATDPSVLVAKIGDLRSERDRLRGDVERLEVDLAGAHAGRAERERVHYALPLRGAARGTVKWAPPHARANYAYDCALEETPWVAPDKVFDAPEPSLRRTRDVATSTATSVGDAALRRSLSVVAAHARERNVWASARDRDALLMGASHGVEPARAIAVDGLLSLATYEANKVPLWGHARGRSALYGTAFGGLAPPLRESARRRLAALLAGDDVLAARALTGPAAAAAEAARRADARAAALAAAEAMRALRRREGRRAGLAPDPAAAAAATTAEARAARRRRRARQRRADELDADAARRAADDARALLMRLARKGRPIDPVLRDGRAARIEASAGDLKRARAQAGKLGVLGTIVGWLGGDGAESLEIEYDRGGREDLSPADLEGSHWGDDEWLPSGSPWIGRRVVRLVAPPLAEGSKRRPSSLLKKGKPPTETVATCVGFSRGVDEASGEPLYRLRYDSGRLAGTYLHVLGADIAARAWPADAPPAPPLPSVRRGDVLAALRSVDLRPAGSPQGDVAALQAGATLRLGLGGRASGAREPHDPARVVRRARASARALFVARRRGETLRGVDVPADLRAAPRRRRRLHDPAARRPVGDERRRARGARPTRSSAAASAPAAPAPGAASSPAAEAGRPRRTPSWLSMERLLADVAGLLADKPLCLARTTACVGTLRACGEKLPSFDDAVVAAIPAICGLDV
ncbi:hypothetical protein JL722_7773 [Aureococcus anophagefferens]|nr:hypothetical protein JL722_7773 [Aureococcus anophagefferens]